MCDMTHLHVRHDWFIHETWLIYITRHRQFVTQDTDSSCLMSCVTYEDMWPTWDRNCLCQRCLVSRIFCLWIVTECLCLEETSRIMSVTWDSSCLICDITHSCVRHDAFIRETWLIHMCDMTHSYVWHDSFTCATWLIHMCDMAHSCMRHDSFMLVTWLIHICDMTHSYMWDDLLMKYIARNCSTLQHTATHCNALQHTPTHCNTRQHTATHCNTLQHTATLQHIATHSHTLQLTATHCNMSSTRKEDQYHSMGWLRLVGSSKW